MRDDVQDCDSQKGIESQDYFNVAMSCVLAEDFEEAKSAFTIAIQMQPHNPAAYLARGNVHRSLDEYQQAMDDYAISIKQQPHNPAAYLELGVTHYINSNFDQAIDYFTTSIIQQLHNPEAYCLRGKAHLTKGRVFEALDDLKVAKNQGMIGLEKSISTTAFFVTAAMRTNSNARVTESKSSGLTASSLSTLPAQAAPSPQVSGASQSFDSGFAKSGSPLRNVCAER